MKKLILVLVLMVMLAGCGMWEQSCSRVKSSAIKLNRTITLYASDGSIIKTWNGRFNVSHGNGGSARFIDKGKVVRISGTYLIEEN